MELRIKHRVMWNIYINASWAKAFRQALIASIANPTATTTEFLEHIRGRP